MPSWMRGRASRKHRRHAPTDCGRRPPRVRPRARARTGCACAQHRDQGIGSRLHRILPGHFVVGAALLVVLRGSAVRLSHRPGALRDPRARAELRRLRSRGGARRDQLGAAIAMGGGDGAGLQSLAAAAPGGLPTGLGGDDSSVDQSPDPTPEGNGARELYPSAGLDLRDRPTPADDRKYALRVRRRTRHLLRHRLRADTGDERAGGAGEESPWHGTVLREIFSLAPTDPRGLEPRSNERPVELGPSVRALPCCSRVSRSPSSPPFSVS